MLYSQLSVVGYFVAACVAFSDTLGTAVLEAGVGVGTGFCVWGCWRFFPCRSIQLAGLDRWEKENMLYHMLEN